MNFYTKNPNLKKNILGWVGVGVEVEGGGLVGKRARVCQSFLNCESKKKIWWRGYGRGRGEGWG